MITLYHGGGARDYEIKKEVFPNKNWEQVKRYACKMLQKKKAVRAASLLEIIPFVLYEGTNGFGDEFSVLLGYLPFDQYMELSENQKNHEYQRAGEEISEVISEITSTYVRFVDVGFNTDTTSDPIPTPKLQITSEVVERALADAEQLLRTRDAVSAVDRVHTAFHGYLKAIVNQMGLPVDPTASPTQLYKIIRESNPAFVAMASGGDEINKIVRSISGILDAVNTIRNRTSIAHPNDSLIDEIDAMLVINIVRSLLHYIDAILGRHSIGISNSTSLDTSDNDEEPW